MLNTEQKDAIDKAIKRMLASALRFDNYRKSILEDYWPPGVDDNDDAKELAYSSLEDHLMRMEDATRDILTHRPTEKSEIPF